MIIENIPLKLASLNLQQVRFSNEIIGLNKDKHLKLTDHQMQVLEQIALGKNVSQIIQHFLSRKIMPSFLAIRDLLDYLIGENLLLNPELKSYFAQNEAEAKSFLDEVIEKLSPGQNDTGINLSKEIDQMPFFRSLDANTKKAFLANSRVIETPAEIAICTEGQKQTSLFALLRGEARVVRKTPSGQRKIAVLKAGAVFGETGFFLGAERTATVITNTKCVVAKFKYLPELFESKIDVEAAKQLQKRFWMIHALLRSDIFKELPQDCFDSLIFAGNLVKFSPEQVICTEGQPGDACYLIIQGQLIVSQKGQSIRVLSQGDCFGEMAIILNRGIRTASVKAQTEALAMAITYDKFYTLMSENLFLACEFERLALERWQGDLER